MKSVDVVVIRVCRAVFLSLIDKGDTAQEIEKGRVGGGAGIAVGSIVAKARNIIGLVVVVGKQRIKKVVFLGEILPFYQGVFYLFVGKWTGQVFVYSSNLDMIELKSRF